jgi:hypothetical protein
MNNQRFRPLMNKMLTELLDCWQRKTPEVLIVGAAYMITMKYWKEDKSECWQNPFTTAEEEISFFKNIKCQFTGRLAYYSILYESLASLPLEKDAGKTYWKNELKRYKEFVEKHGSFVDYLAKGDNQLDAQYFLRKNLTGPVPAHLAMYDGDPEFCTARDYLVSGWFAETHYHQYVLGKLDV